MQNSAPTNESLLTSFLLSPSIARKRTNLAGLMKVMDRIQPGVVVWKRVNIAPKNRFKKVENGNYVIDIAKVREKTGTAPIYTEKNSTFDMRTHVYFVLIVMRVFSRQPQKILRG